MLLAGPEIAFRNEKKQIVKQGLDPPFNQPTAFTVIMCTVSLSFMDIMHTLLFALSPQLAAHYNVLSRITQLGMVISIICLFMCIFTFWFFSEIQSTRTTIHKNLCCSLFMAEFIFLIGINMYAHKVSSQNSVVAWFVSNSCLNNVENWHCLVYCTFYFQIFLLLYIIVVTKWCIATFLMTSVIMWWL